MKQISLIIILLLPGWPAAAQEVKSWEVGLAVMTGRNFYDKKYYDQPGLAPGWDTNFKSNYLWTIGGWGEKRISQHFSAVAELRYMLEDAPEDMLCFCNLVSEVLQVDEKHFWAAADLGLRYYINPASKVSLFAEARGELDWLVAASETRFFMDDHLFKTYLDWNAMGYKQLAPGVSFSLGLKWKGVALSVARMTNVARTITRSPGMYDHGYYPIKTGFLAKGLYAKVAFTLVKIRK